MRCTPANPGFRQKLQEKPLAQALQEGRSIGLRAAGNDLLVPLGFVIEAALAALFDYTVRPKYWKAAKPLHEAIAVAIRQRRPEAARRAVRRLLEDTDTIIERRLHASRTSKRRQPAALEWPQASKLLNGLSLAK